MREKGWREKSEPWRSGSSKESKSQAEQGEMDVHLQPQTKTRKETERVT